MPPRRITSPKTLEELCLSEIVTYFGRECLFCTQVRKYQDDSLLLRRRGINAQALERELESYLDILPPLLNEIVRQHITNEVLKANAASLLSHPEIYVGLLDIVLNKDVKVLEFSDETHVSYESAIWSIIMKKCTGLKRFVITKKTVGIHGGGHVQPFLKKVILNCPTLTELVLKEIVQGCETLSIIGKTCPILKVLDISGSQVNCIELAHLFVNAKSRNVNVDAIIDGALELNGNPLCSTLEVLVLAESAVKVKGAALAVKMLRNLISLGNFNYLPAALKRLYGTKSKVTPPLKITQAYYYGPSHTKLKALANCCPVLETLHVGCEKMRRISPSCFSYGYLKTLTLENIEFEAIIACAPLLPQLVELKISTIGIDVGLLGQHCQNLEKLSLCGEPLKIPSRPSNCVPFAKLKKLKMQCIASAECVGFIVKQALGLKVIDIVRVKELTDAVFAEWFQWNPLLHLETLMIRYAELTRASVDLLLEQCPQLTRLGELGGWDIRSWECRRLKDLVLRENYKLHLVLYSRNADSIIIDILTENTSSDEELVV